MIYFISDGGSLIKIGFTTNLDERLSALRAGSPRLSVIATMEGSRGHERAIHWDLREFRKAGEWFDDCEAVRLRIAEIVRSGITESKTERTIKKDALAPISLEAIRFGEIISECRPELSLQEAENTYGIPRGTLWRLRYRPDNSLHTGPYFALRAGAKRAAEDLAARAVELAAFVSASEERDRKRAENVAFMEAEIGRMQDTLRSRGIPVEDDS